MDEKEITDVTWIPLLLISLAAFIITLDSTFMNVAISQLITDLNTTVSTVQLIISFYTLITASLMLIGSRLQDIIGKKKVFLIGAGIYGIGALLAAISQNALMLFTGWSLLEGIGGSLMTPATISIASQTYKSDKRTFALAMISAMAGIAAAGVTAAIFAYLIGLPGLVLSLVGVRETRRDAEAGHGSFSLSALLKDIWKALLISWIFMLLFNAIPSNLSMLITEQDLGASQAAGIVLTVREGKSTTNEIDKAIKAINMSHSDILGFVLTDVDIKGVGYGYYQYNYGYGDNPKGRR